MYKKQTPLLSQKQATLQYFEKLKCVGHLVISERQNDQKGLGE